MRKAAEKNVQRRTKYINGGHSLLEENVSQLQDLIKEFLIEEYS